MSPAELPDDADLLAAELAFGVAEGGDSATAEDMLARDPAFAAAYARWLDHAVGLVGAEEEAPDPRLWNAISLRLAGNDAEPMRGGASALRRWRIGAVAAALAASALGVVALHKPDRPPVIVRVERPVQPPLVAVLSGADKAAVLTVSFDRASGRITAVPRHIATGDKVAELWVIPAGQKPRAIGVISAERPTWRPIPQDLRHDVTEAAVLAVSIEPAGGSPTGQPTGPVILSGKGSFAS